MKSQQIRFPYTRTLPAATWVSKITSFSVLAGTAATLAVPSPQVLADVPSAPAIPPRQARKAAQPLRAANVNRSGPELLRRQSEYRLSGQTNAVNLLAGSDNCPGNVVPAGTYTSAAPFTDSGTTAGANNTVVSYGYYEAAYGPDHIYTFTLSAVGPNPKIEVSTTSGTYNVKIFVLNGLTYDRCPNYSDAWLWIDAMAASDTAGMGGTETISGQAMNNMPRNIPLHLFVDSAVYTGASNNSGPYTIKFEDVTLIETPPVPAIDAPLDVSGDGKTDLSIVRTSGAQMTWYTRTSGDQFLTAQNWGVEGDKPVPADYDGDGRDDIAIWRPGPQGRFYIIGSRDQTFYVTDFGQTGDDPSVVADYTGDGADDLAVYRPGASTGAQSYWFYRPLRNPPNAYATVPWGQHGDVPVPGNIDGWDRADFMVRRPEGQFARYYLRYDYGSQQSFLFGLADDLSVPAAYEYYRAMDWAVVRPGADGFLHWYIPTNLSQPGSFIHRVWGVAATDIPAPGDYDGDGLSEIAVWRPGTPGAFYTLAVQSGVISVRQWGQTGDVPAAAFRNH